MATKKQKVPAPPSESLKSTGVGRRKPTPEDVANQELGIVSNTKQWDLPVFVLNEDFINYHNEMSAKYKGHQTTWVMAGKIKSMKALVKQRNDKALDLSGIEHDMIPEAIARKVKSFANDMITIVADTLSATELDLNMAIKTGQGAWAGAGDQIPLLLAVVTACGLSCVKKPTDAQARAALSLPQQLKTVLGVDNEQMFQQVNPQMVIKIEILEGYMAKLYNLHSYYSNMGHYEYDGPIPEDPMDDLREMERQSAADNGWDQQDHSITMES